MKERALAIGVFNSGTAIGSMMAAPIVSFLAVQWGWRMAFVVTGALGFVWVAAWWFLFRQPADHPRLSPEERTFIESGRDGKAASEKAVPLKQLLRMREAWGCILIRGCTDPISYFLLFWIPLYFQKKHGFDLKAIGMFVWIPFAVAAVGNVMGGAIPRLLISRGWSLDRARKTTMTTVSGVMLCGCLLATQVNHVMLGMTLVAIMMFCHAAGGNITLPAEVFPKQAVGTITGLGGAFGSILGALSQWYLGDVVDAYGFAPIFVACSAMYPLAMVLVFTMIGTIGEVRRIPEPR
jgi:ACS family hexuronate transporter-like MFS transporter